MSINWGDKIPLKLTSKDWFDIIKNIATEEHLDILYCMLEKYNSAATCKELQLSLAHKYKAPVVINRVLCKVLAKNVLNQYPNAIPLEEFEKAGRKNAYWHILFYGKWIPKKGFLWGIRPELEEALNKYKLTYKIGDELYQDEFKIQKTSHLHRRKDI